MISDMLCPALCLFDGSERTGVPVDAETANTAVLLRFTRPKPNFGPVSQSFPRFNESVLTCVRVGLYYKLRGVHRPVSMKKGVIKRQKRVPVAAAVAAINANVEGRQADQFVVDLPLLPDKSIVMANSNHADYTSPVLQGLAPAEGPTNGGPTILLSGINFPQPLQQMVYARFGAVAVSTV
jgi:hypothetical protein